MTYTWSQVICVIYFCIKMHAALNYESMKATLKEIDDTRHFAISDGTYTEDEHEVLFAQGQKMRIK